MRPPPLAASSHVVVPVRANDQEHPAPDFLRALRFGTAATIGNWVRFARASLLNWPSCDGHRRNGCDEPARLGRASAQCDRAVDYACIANELRFAGAILQAMRRSHTHTRIPASMTETEAQLARIWAELLERPSVTRDDNFFDLGGHSLLAVLLLLRIRESFGVELSIDDVYSGTLTLADLATRIEDGATRRHRSGGVRGTAGGDRRPVRRGSARNCWPEDSARR